MSILDYKQNELSPQIWNKDNKLKPGVKSFIYTTLEGFYYNLDLRGDKNFNKGIYIASSLATYYYKDDSDLDIKIIIDIDSFKAHNPKYESWSHEDILEWLIDEGRESMWLTAVIPGTLHVLDAYFYSTEEFKPDMFIKYDSLYSITKGEWIKEPKDLSIDDDPGFILNNAKEKAKSYLDKLTLDIAQTKRDTIDFYILMDYLKGLDEEDLSKYSSTIIQALEEVNTSVETLVKDKELLKQMRRGAFSKKQLDEGLSALMNSLNYTDENLVFKVVQRYGYLRILSEISRLFEDKKITMDEVGKISDILKNN